MNSKQILTERMKMRGYTYESLAKKLGYAHASGVSQRFRNKQEMRVDIFLKMLEIMDCELIVRSTCTNDKTEWKVTLDEGAANAED